MACFPEIFYRELTNDMMIEWLDKLKLKVKPSYLTLDYYESISFSIEEQVTELREKGETFRFFAFSSIDDDSKDYAVLIDNKFDLIIYEFERRDYYLSGPKLTILYTNLTFGSFSCNPSWSGFLYEKLGDSFLKFEVFSLITEKIIREYIIQSKIVSTPNIHIVTMFDNDERKVYVFSDSLGYEYRLTVNSNMDCFILRAHVAIQEVSSRIPYYPELYPIDGEVTLFEYVKDKYLDSAVK